MTAHPLILPSAVLSKSLHNPLCTFYTSFQPTVKYYRKSSKAGRSITDERRLKRQYGMSIYYRKPHQQGVSTTNERRKGETDFRFLSCRFHAFVIYCHPVLNRLRMNFILGNTSINETSCIIFITELDYLCYLCPEPTCFPKAGCFAERRNPENFRSWYHGF